MADRMSGRDGGPNLTLIIGSVVTALLVLSVAVVLLTRSDDEAAPLGPEATTTVPTVVTGATPEPPTEVTASIDAAGTLTVTFVAETTSAPSTYRLVRSRGTWPGDRPWVDGAETTVVVEGLAAEDPACFTVATIRSGTISDPSPEVCASPTPTASPPPAEAPG